MFTRLKFLTVIFLFSVLLGCGSNSSSGSGSSSVSPYDLHNYEFWSEESINGAEARLTEAYASSMQEVEQLFAIEHKTYMNFVRPYTEIDDRLIALLPYSYLNYISTNTKLQRIIDTFLQLNADYNAFIMKYDAETVAIVNNIMQSESLNPAQIRSLEMLRQLSASAALPKGKQDRVLQINARIAQLEVTYDRNLMELAARSSVMVTDESLLGDMPKWMKAKYVSVPNNDKTSDSDIERSMISPSWAFAPSGESFQHFMKYVPDRELRKQMYMSARVGDNIAVVDEILQLRHEKADIFGDANYAEYRNKTEMSAPSVEEVKRVLQYNIDVLKDMLYPQQQQALQLAQKDGIEKLEPYDRDYYMRQALEAETNEINIEELFASYFEKWKTIDGVLNKLGQIYNVEFKEQPITLWNNSAKKYSIWRNNGEVDEIWNNDNEFVGTLFIDFDSAPLKTAGAFVSGIIKRHLDKNNTLINPVAFMLLDFPADAEGYTSTLTFYYIVSTFMHELGHLLHHILPKSEETLTAGAENFKWDNVEYMSTFHEMLPFVSNEILQDISESIDNGTKIPDEFLNQYMKIAKSEVASTLLYAGLLGLIDISIYSGNYGYDNATLLANNTQDIYHIDLTDLPHIFSLGYDAAFYTYIWGQLHAADSLLYMKDPSGKLGLNEAKLNDFYQKLIKPAGTKDFNDLYKDFRGDQFDNDALIKILDWN